MLTPYLYFFFFLLTRSIQDFERDKQMAREIHQKEIKEAWNALNEEKARMQQIIQFQEEQVRLDVGGALPRINPIHLLRLTLAFPSVLFQK